MTESEKATVQADERKRIDTILSHDAAKNRQDLARHLALSTPLSVEAAVFTLKVAAKDAGEITTLGEDDTAFVDKTMAHYRGKPAQGARR